MRIGRLELTLRERDAGEAREPGMIRRFWRRGVAVAAVLLVVALPGSQLAMRMAADDDKGPEPADDLLDAEAAEYVQANWERAIGIDDVYVEDDLALEDEELEPLTGALGVSGIPEIALDAYYGAEDTLAVDDPDCGVPWSLLAAIGRVESNHGRFGGAELLEDGYGTKPIRGIPLDGRPGVALIRDTDDGALDDDPVYDRAVGPMQFIPTTWPNVAADANGDNEEDPDNIYDAATGAGVYLCAGGGNLFDDRDDRAAAVKRYNNSDEYVRTVLSLAEMYEEGGVDDLAFEDSEGFEDDLGPEIDDDTGFESQLGPEIDEEIDDSGFEEPAPAPNPVPPAPAEVPTLPNPPSTPGSVGWPSGMNELPPAELPPPVPLPGETTTTLPPTTSTPPTTLPDCPADAEDEVAEDQAPTNGSTTVPSTTVPPAPDATTTTVPPVDDCDPAVDPGPDAQVEAALPAEA